MNRAPAFRRPAPWPPASRVALLLVLAAIAGGCDRPAPPPPGPPPAAASATGSAANAVHARGEKVYNDYCALCHMPDGNGVPNFQPPLVGSAVVAGDPARLEAVIRAGSAALGGRESDYSAVMPPFGTLSDADVKAVVAYVRERFGTAAGPASP